MQAIERRSRRAFAPGWVAWLQRFRGLLGKSADRDMLKVAPEIERLSAEEVVRRGIEEASLSDRTRALRREPAPELSCAAARTATRAAPSRCDERGGQLRE